jgi:hypothetical protein
VEIAGVSHPSADEGLAAMVNQLFVGTVTKDYFGSKLECRAQGSKLIQSVVKEVTLQIYCKFVLSEPKIFICCDFCILFFQ